MTDDEAGALPAPLAAHEIIDMGDRQARTLRRLAQAGSSGVDINSAMAQLMKMHKRGLVSIKGNARLTAAGRALVERMAVTPPLERKR